MKRVSYLTPLIFAFLFLSSSAQISSAISQGFLPLAGNKIDEVVIGYGDDGIVLTESNQEDLDIDIERVKLDVENESEWTVEWETEGNTFHLIDKDGDISIVGSNIQLAIGALISSIAKVPKESVGDLIGTLAKNAITAANSAATVSSFTAADVIDDATKIVIQNIEEVDETSNEN